jgi:lambda repressor-like predicted transcriptional regulator
MTPIQIVRALQSRQTTQAEVAEKAGLDITSRAQVSAVIHRRSRSQRIESAIASATGLGLHQLWPEWYEANGKRIRRLRRI